MNKFIIFTLIFTFSMTIYGSEERLFFNTFPIPLMVESKEKGVFIDLVNEIAKRAQLDIEISVSPPKRAINQFLKKNVDALFPALDANFPSGIKVVRSSELIYKRRFCFHF